MGFWDTSVFMLTNTWESLSDLWSVYTYLWSKTPFALRVMTLQTPGPSNGEPGPIPQAPSTTTTHLESPKTVGTLRVAVIEKFGGCFWPFHLIGSEWFFQRSPCV